MQKINIVGPYFGTDGYSSHVRQLTKALIEEGVIVRVETSKFPGWEVQCSDSELLALNREFTNDMTTVYVGVPPMWRFSLMDSPKKFYGFLVWEGEFIPKYWIKYLLDERVDGILVPSEHVKQAIMNTELQVYESDTFTRNLLERKIHVVPHGVDVNLFKPGDAKHDKFTFLVNKGWSQGLNDRGGVQYAIKAFCEEFKKDEHVCLKVKINMSYAGPGWDLNKELEALNLPKEHAELLISTTMVDYKDLPKFYQDGDVFVNATRAEAFSIPGLEAKACGLPTIQTGYGGQLDYMTKYDERIDFELEYVTHDIAYEGNKWANPKIDSLRQQMRKAFEFRYGFKEEISLEAHNWTWRDSAKKLLEAIK